MNNVRKHLSIVVALGSLSAAGLLAVACGGGDDTKANPTDSGTSDTGVDSTVPPVDSGTDTATPTDSGKPDVATDAPSDAPVILPTGFTDRSGRALLIFGLVDPGLKDIYNSNAQFWLPNPSSVVQSFQENLVLLDQMDGVSDWDGGSPEGGTRYIPNDAGPDGGDAGGTTLQTFPHPLVVPFQFDGVLVDPNKPFGPNGYLEIEYNTLVLGTPGAHLTCGGRWLADDAVDKTLSFIVKKNLTGVTDNVNQATKAPSETFPYLAPPN